VSIVDLLPRSGRALDVAGGNGRNAVVLAERGMDVTVVDVSDLALEIARGAAGARRISLTLVNADLESGDVPAGPWNLIVCFHYLQRDLFPKMIDVLAPGGLLACAIATVHNLELHDRPPRPFVLDDDDELPRLVEGLTVLRYEVGWFDDHHEARMLARK
jgi:tellurite methyltransferase